MRLAAWFAAAVLFGQDPKPGDAAVKAVRQFLASDGAALKATIETAYHKLVLKGFQRKGYCVLRGTGEILKDVPYLGNEYGTKNEYEYYANQDQVRVRIKNDKFPEGYVEPAKIGGEDGILTATIRNARAIFEEVEWASKKAEWKREENLNGTPCRVAELTLTDEHQKVEVFRRMVSNHREGRAHANPGTIRSVVDEKQSVLAYRVWLGKEDGRLRKIEKKVQLELEPHLKELAKILGSGGGGGEIRPEPTGPESSSPAPFVDLFSGIWVYEFAGEPPEIQVPAEVASAIGAPPKPKKKP